MTSSVVMSAPVRLASPGELEAFRGRILAEQKTRERVVRVCIGTGCAAKGSRRLFEVFRQAAAGGADGRKAMLSRASTWAATACASAAPSW